MPPLALALFDMAATTVDDTIDGRPLVLQTFADCLRQVQVTVPWEVLNGQRGKDKLEVFRLLLATYSAVQGEALEHTAQCLLHDFTARLLRNVTRLHEIPGATTTLTFLKQHHIFIAVGSGFPLPVTTAIADHLGWLPAGLVDYVTCGEAAGAGRPHPHMLNLSLQAAGLLDAASPIDQPIAGFDYGCVMKVGDTVQDMAEGCNVGALTIAVASGTQSAAMLQQAGAAVVLPSVAALPAYLQAHGYL
jgi:phosphoglycolate phosphatase-like HAD superfamily hydrolase